MNIKLIIAATLAISVTSVFPQTQSTLTYTADKLFETAMNRGFAEGILIGNQADEMKSQTRSTDSTIARLVRGEATKDGCQIFMLTLTQPNVPTATGESAGDYVATNKVTVCKDDRPPTAEVVACTVGKLTCMPVKK
jgi:hypothetical protein